MKKIDMLWLIEHNAREMDIACAVKSIVQTQYGMDIVIKNVYLHANEVMNKYIPRLVIFPFFYRISDLAIENYVKVWPDAIAFNLAMEQVHYKAHLKMKAPGDDFSRQRVIHHAWGKFYKNYLLENGVPEEHIFVNGNPVYQLYKEPYSKYFKQRIQLAQQIGIDPAKKWIFIPENYKWAFLSDNELKNSVKRGGNLDEHLNMRAFCRESLTHVLHWCNEVGKREELEIIFRPRPAVNSRQMEAYFNEEVGSLTKHLHFTKIESVRDWSLASDVVISSYSTSLIEAAVAGKSIYMLEPIPIPDSLSCDWYGFVQRIHNGAEFEESCLSPKKNNNCELQTWAQNEMLANGDPIKGLADYVVHLLESTPSSTRYRIPKPTYAFDSPVLVSFMVRSKWRWERVMSYTQRAVPHLLSAVKIFLRYLVGGFPWVFRYKENLNKSLASLRLGVQLFFQGFKDKNYFDPVTHENDIFTERDVNERVKVWRAKLAED